ncbi:NADPH-dependent F420 reductase [Hymenobacter terrenus]|uniref:NADPH-dependent F420 reductase n=1 Tax=Hymenobacter terrenus TaxID=1629124 RepID=UPI000619BB12|nr:NAD(P)-binding domain-containing protein [Hymenobacter terrenus]
MKIAILGTGAVGQRLGHLLAPLAYSVGFGSRNPTAKAPELAGDFIGSYHEAAVWADVAVLAVPWAGESGRNAQDIVHPLAGPLAGKILIDATNPLQPDWSPAPLDASQSAAEELTRWLPHTRVVKAFNTVFADVMTPALLDRGFAHPPTAFLCGDDPAAKETVSQLAQALGFDPVDAGALVNARYLEGMAHLNIQLAVAMQGGTRAAFRYMRAR